MARIIHFTADDLGLDEQTNLAIEHAHQHGALTAASLMLGQPGTAHAVEVARRNPALHLGFHFHICDSRPVTRARWPWGNSSVLAGIAIGVWPSARALVLRELHAQWSQFMATGLRCQFINGHHHMHIHPTIARKMHELLTGQFDGWVRSMEARFFDVPERGRWPFRWLQRRSRRWLRHWPGERRADSLWGIDRTFCMKSGEVARVLQRLPDGRHEFMFHPRKPGDLDHAALLELQAISPGLPNSTVSL